MGVENNGFSLLFTCSTTEGEPHLTEHWHDYYHDHGHHGHQGEQNACCLVRVWLGEGLVRIWLGEGLVRRWFACCLAW